MRAWASCALLITSVDAGELEANEGPGYYAGRRFVPPSFEYDRNVQFPPPASNYPGYNQRPAYSPIVLPLVDVTRYWRLWGLQQSLCDTVSSALEERNIKELTSNQATQIGRAMERTHSVYSEYHRNMIPEVSSERDQMAAEARLWLGHDQFDRDLYNCWSDVNWGTGPGMNDIGVNFYMACRELLQLPKNSMRRFKEQLKMMKEEATMILRRMGRPTKYNYNRNQFYYGDPYVWAEGTASNVFMLGAVTAVLVLGLT